MNISDFVMVIAVLLAPFLAVFAQKQIELWRERRNTKMWIFKTLMSTRSATVSPIHVQALNMIDLEFSLKKPKERKVRQIWREYLMHLGSLDLDPEKIKSAMPIWTSKNQEYLADLLIAMGECLDYDFDKVYIKQSIYAPEGHARDDLETRAIRLLLLQILNGEKALPVALLPPNEEVESFGKKFRSGLIDLLQGKSELKVDLRKPSVKND